MIEKIKERNFRKKWLILVFMVIITFLIFFYKPFDNTIQLIEKELKTFNPYYVNDCQILMMEKNLTYALCTLKDGKIVLKNSTTFKPTDYICLQVNLQKLDIPFDPYYICAYSNFPIYETPYPKRYGKTKAEIHYSSFLCSSLLYKKDFHNLAMSGFVLNKKGEYIVMRVYAFSGDLPVTYDFRKNLDKGIVVLDLKGKIFS